MIKYKTIQKKIDDMDMSKILRDFCLSQRCEDYLVNLIFNFKVEGIFIDIGAHDGVRFSNSYSFSQIGWKGICIEPHPEYYELCYNNRENNNTKVLNIGCSNENNDSVTFYSNYRGSLSTLNENLNTFYKKNYNKYYVDKEYSKKINNFTNGPIKIKCCKLNTVIENYKKFLNNGNIDLISIDVDGSEEYVLKGFDILKYKPRIIIFEVSVVRDIVEKYMKDKKYYKIYDNKLNAIYCRDYEDTVNFFKKLERLRNKQIIAFDTGHPLGN